MTELVLDTQLDAEQREYLNMAKLSADSLLSLINASSIFPDRGWQT